MDGEGYYVGLDGGGTSTRLAVADAQGTIIRRVAAGASNVLAVGWQRAEASVAEVWEQAGIQASDVSGMVVGLAGSDRDDVRGPWRQYLTRMGIRRFWLVGDYRLAWAALTGGAPGAVAVVGTGSVVYGEDGRRSLRAGGYGWQLGDEGSGFWLGRQAVRACLADWEGVGPETKLSVLIERKWGVATPAQLLAYWYAPDFDRRGVADLAVDVIQLAAADFVAQGLVGDACRTLAALLAAVVDRLAWQPGWPAGLAGGLAPWLIPYLKREWWSLARMPAIQIVPAAPVEGAVRLARQWVNERRAGDGQVDGRNPRG